MLVETDGRDFSRQRKETEQARRKTVIKLPK